MSFLSQIKWAKYCFYDEGLKYVLRLRQDQEPKAAILIVILFFLLPFPFWLIQLGVIGSHSNPLKVGDGCLRLLV